MAALHPLLALCLAIALGASPALAAKVAVLEFANHSSDPEWEPLGKGLQELFLVDLDKAGTVQVLERRDVLERARALGVATPSALADRRKLAADTGASHVLSGSFAVRENTLALTIELLDASRGKILLNEEHKGDADAFFDVQKQALQASIRALDLNLSARERAETGRLHTADFQAFRDFSRGLDLFDAERYEASLTALRAATERDVQFGLARLTLEAYEQLIAQTRQKAQAIHAVKVEERRLARLQAAGEEVEVVRKLIALAGLPGPDNQRVRLTALHTLAMVYDGPGGRHRRLRELFKVEDRFEIARARERYFVRYQDEARPLWPALPIRPSEEFFVGLPSLDTFDRDMERAVARLWEHGADYPINRTNYLISNARYPVHTARARHLSLADEVRFEEELLALAIGLGLDDGSQRRANDDLVKRLRTVLRFDDSTRLLQDMASKSDNEWALKGFADDMERNRRAVAFLQSKMDPDLAREWLYEGWGIPDDDRLSDYTPPLSPRAKGMLTRLRKWPTNSFILLDDVPLWPVNNPYAIRLGPRSDPRRTTSLRLNSTKEDGQPFFVAGGAQPLGDITLTTRVRYTVPDDFWPGLYEPGREDRRIGEGRPTVGIAFGLEDIDVPLQKNAAAEQSAQQRAAGATADSRVLARPMTGYLLEIREREIAIVRIVEAERGMYDRKERLDRQEITSVPLKKAGDDLPVRLTVQGDRLDATVGRTRIQARLPEAPNGYQGFWVEGPGFVEIEGLTLRGSGD